MGGSLSLWEVSILTFARLLLGVFDEVQELGGGYCALLRPIQ